MSLKKKRIVIITGPGFEEPEVIYPFYRLQEAGYIIDVATSNNLEVYGKHGYKFSPTIKIKDLIVKSFDAVVIPGGHEAPDRVRQVDQVLKFVKEMNTEGKIISSTCHGPWVLISSGVLKGRRATCYRGMMDDLINSGAKYEKRSVVVDKNIVTSDHPRNIAEWVKTTIELIDRN